MFYLITFNDICKYMLIVTFDGSKMFKQVGTGAAKYLLWNALKHLFGSFHRYPGSLVTGHSILSDH